MDNGLCLYVLNKWETIAFQGQTSATVVKQTIWGEIGLFNKHTPTREVERVVKKIDNSYSSLSKAISECGRSTFACGVACKDKSTLS